jgi:hypothetical protein
LREKGQSKLKLSGNGNECKPLDGGNNDAILQSLKKKANADLVEGGEVQTRLNVVGHTAG